jgi:putative MFS transporter
LRATGITPTQFIWLSLFLGFGVGYWPIFVTIPAEQFGTNIRATVTTTVPNFIRASLIPINGAFAYFTTKYNMITSGYIMITILSVIALFAVSQLKESFHKELDYVEEM